MWPLVPILAAIGFLEVLVPWPDLAALVLTNAHPVAAHTVSMHLTLSVGPRQGRSPPLVQVGDASP